jgi:hypothetical protein
MFPKVGPFGKTTAVMSLVVVVAMAAAGGAVYAWRQGEINDREDALAGALRERGDARETAAGLRGNMEDLKGLADALRARMRRLNHLKRLRSERDDLAQRLEAPPDASCDPDAMIAVVRDQVELGVEGMFWESVEVSECQSGYARAVARPGGTPPPGWNLEDGEQVFLRDENGAWTVITSGSGLTCSDEDPPDVVEACAALDLS